MIKNIIQYTFNKFNYKVIKKNLRIPYKIEDSKFDFVLFSGGRTGSRALQYFLNQHEKIYILSRKELYYSIKNGAKGIKKLINKYSRTLNKSKCISIEKYKL